MKVTLEINHEPEYLPKRASSNCIHGTRLKVHQDSLNQNLTVVKDIIKTSTGFFFSLPLLGIKLSIFYPWDIFATRGLIEVDIDSFQLDLSTVSTVGAGRVNPMLIATT